MIYDLCLGYSGKGWEALTEVPAFFLWRKDT